MRVVLDTNVLVSAYVFSGICQKIVLDLTWDAYWYSSHAMLDELAKTLVRKFAYSPDKVTLVMNQIRGRCELVTPTPLPTEACRDPDDLLVLGTMVAAHADYLVTGDQDLLSVSPRWQNRIVSPREFLSILQQNP